MNRIRNVEFGMRSSKPWLGLVVVLALMGTARGQGGVPAEGTEILRGLIKYHGLKPVETVGNPAQSTLVVVVGNAFLAERTKRDIRDRLLPAGGSLVVISDKEIALRNFLPDDGQHDRNVRVAGTSVACNRPENCFRQDPDSPLAQVQAEDPTGLAGLKLLQGQGVILATREPHTLVPPLRNSLLAVEIVKFPRGSRYAGGVPVPADTPLALMQAPDSDISALVYADRAMFLNEFMVATDGNGNRTDNFLYSFLLVRHLAGRLKANGGPMECLFIEDGVVNTDFDRVGFVERPEMNLPPGIPPVLPPLPVLMDFVLDKGNELVAKAEERDIPNVIQQKDHSNQIQNGLLSTLAVVLSVVLARYLLARGWGTRHAPELAPRARIDPDRGGVIPERRYALLESGNLYEPMRDHLRVVFAQWGAPGDLRDGLPPIATDRPTRPVKRIAADLFRLWTIAYAPERTTVAPDDLEELEDMISELSNAHAAGVWRFPAGVTA